MMALEVATFIEDLNSANPTGADGKNEGDNHIRLLKAAIKATLPGLAGRAWRVQTKGTNYNLAASDNMTVISVSAPITLGAAAAATLGNGFIALVHADGGAVTFDPNAAETINGATTRAIPQGSVAALFCTGAAWNGFSLPVGAGAAPTGSGNFVLATAPTISNLTMTDTPTAPTPSPGDSSTKVATTAFVAAGLANIQQSIWVPALAMVPRTTAGAAVNRIESSTNKVISQTLDFDAVTQEHAQFTVRMPQGWDEGTFTAFFLWSHPATATNFGVAWGLQAFARSNAEALDVSFGTAIVTTDVGGLTDTLYQSDVSAAMTVGQTPAENDFVQFQVYRDVANGGDTMAVDARLHGILLIYTINTLDDQ